MWPIRRLPGQLLVLVGILATAVALGVMVIRDSVTVVTVVVLLWALFTVVVGADRIGNE